MANLVDPVVVPSMDDLCKQGKCPTKKIDHARVSQRCDLLKGRLKVIEGIDNLEGMNTNELVLVHDLIIQPKFKLLEFKKYVGIECPKIHLAIYYRKMDGCIHNEKLIIHVFQDSLIEAAVKWYLKLKRGQVRT